VFVYIHGGGFVGGSATTDAWNLTRITGHVVFAIQYVATLSQSPSSRRAVASSLRWRAAALCT
jgi:acetyl esterase/lipase